MSVAPLPFGSFSFRRLSFGFCFCFCSFSFGSMWGLGGWVSGGFLGFSVFLFLFFWLLGRQICDETGTVNCGNLWRLCPSVSYSLTWGVSAVSFPRYNSLDLRCFFSLYLDCLGFGWEAVPPVIEGFYNLPLKYRGYGRQDWLFRQSIPKVLLQWPGLLVRFR